MAIVTSSNQRKTKRMLSELNNRNPNVSYVEDKKTGIIRRIENKPISDAEVPGLIESGYQQAKEQERHSNNISFHRTEREEELSFQFMMNHGNEIQKHIDSFEDCYRLAFSEKNLDKKIELLRKTIIEFEKAKTWFYRTKGGTIYFQDMYEHLCNSRNDDYSYIDSVEDYLEECETERDYIIPELLKIIESSPEGILQKDIYQHLPDISKSHIQKIIRNFESEGLITREKSKGSYLLTIKDTQNQTSARKDNDV
jgi:hypothetical protein